MCEKCKDDGVCEACGCVRLCMKIDEICYEGEDIVYYGRLCPFDGDALPDSRQYKAQMYFGGRHFLGVGKYLKFTISCNDCRGGKADV